MKRIILSLGLSSVLMMNTFAADIAKLNDQLAEALAPFQNETTQAQALFTEALTSENNALKVSVNATLDKLKAEKNMGFKIENLSYDYGNGIAPKTAFKGFISFDLTKFVSQNDLNALLEEAAPKLEQELKDFYLNQYGDAADTNVMVTSIQRDGEGNYVGLSGVITFKIDLDQITDEKVKKEILITETVLSFNLNTTEGLSINGFSISNPQYEAFAKGEIGLRELLLALELGEHDVTSRIVDFFNDLNSFFDEIPTINAFKLIINAHK